MERTIRCLQLFLTIAVLVVSASASFAQDAELLRHFDYDQKTPLNFKRIGVAHRARADVYDITYDSLKGGVVPAYLVVPKGRGPFAAARLRHGGPGRLGFELSYDRRLNTVATGQIVTRMSAFLHWRFD